jgi:adenylylsulfate kinase-like enzyme
VSFTIAVTGKGGVGKTTLAALIVRGLIAQGRRPVLAVDADPNTCLDTALGIQAENTIGRIREEAGAEARKGLAAGVSRSPNASWRLMISISSPWAGLKARGVIVTPTMSCARLSPKSRRPIRTW